MRSWLLGLVLLAALLAGGAEAADYYVCDCRPGAASGCKPGNDSNRGASPAEAKRSWRAARALLANAACGDTVNLCAGGVWAFDGGYPVSNPADCREKRRVLQPYDPGGVSGRPRVEASGGQGGVLELGFAYSKVPLVGVAVRGIELRHTSPETAGNLLTLNVAGTDALVDDVVLDGGMTQFNGDAVVKIEMEDVVIRNVAFTAMIGGPADGSRFERVRFEHNAYACTKEGGGGNCGGVHAWYLGTESTTKGIVIRDVTMTDSCETAWSGGACTCNLLAIRGGDGILIERLTVDATDSGSRVPQYPCRVAFNQNASSSQSDGIRNGVIRGSTWLNVDNVILCGAQRTVYENNLYVANDSAGGWVPNITPTGLDVANRADCAGGGADLTGDQVTVRNNTTYIAASDVNEMRCLSFRMSEGGGNAVTNNSCTLVDPKPGSNSSGFDYWDEADTQADHNHVHRTNGKGSYGRLDGAPKTLAQMRSALGGCPKAGNECSSIEGDPLFTRPPQDFTLQPTSPLRDAGDAANAPRDDRAGTKRPQGRGVDIGAFEAPSAP